jgi:hypothetical protein
MNRQNDGSTTLMRSALSILALLLVAGSPAGAQTVSGRLLDGATGRPIASGTLALLNADSTVAASVATDTAGNFVLRAPSEGSYHLRGERLGYRTGVTPPLELESDDTLRVEFRLSVDAVELNPIKVMGYSRRPSGPLGGFYDRARRRAFGTFVTREDIEDRKPIQTTDLLRTMPGVQLTPSRFGRYNVLLRGGCVPRVYLDGIPIRMAGLTIDDLVHPNELEGIEVYRSSAEVPGEFSTSGGCGAIALWTRRGGE